MKQTNVGNNQSSLFDIKPIQDVDVKNRSFECQ